LTPLLVSAYTLTTCLGRGLAVTLAKLRDGSSGLAPCAFETVELDTWIGEVAGVDEQRLPPTLAHYDCRNNRLAQLALTADGFAERVLAARDRYGRRPRRRLPRHQHGRHPASRTRLPPA
jgi:3-oxoacyl-[acyl-carrier-protein] synthase-1